MYVSVRFLTVLWFIWWTCPDWHLLDKRWNLTKKKTSLPHLSDDRNIHKTTEAHIIFILVLRSQQDDYRQPTGASGERREKSAHIRLSCQCCRVGNVSMFHFLVLLSRYIIASCHLRLALDDKRAEQERQREAVLLLFLVLLIMMMMRRRKTMVTEDLSRKRSSLIFFSK